MEQMILGFVRHALTAAGGYFIGGGLLTGSDYEAATGAVITLVGVIWSAIEKKQRLLN